MRVLANERYLIVDYLKKGYGSLLSPFSKVQPQMPKQQITHFLKQAVKNRHFITLQVNPTTHSDRINEYSGTPFFSRHSTQIILQTDHDKMTYLINARDIRHIRLEYR